MFICKEILFIFQLGKLAIQAIETEEPEPLTQYEADVLREASKEEMAYEITVLEEKLAQMKPNMAAIAEYRKKVFLY